MTRGARVVATLAGIALILAGMWSLIVHANGVDELADWGSAVATFAGLGLVIVGGWGE